MLAAAELRLTARQALIFQYMITEGLSPNFGPFAEDSNELIVGWKMEAWRNSVIEVGVIENPIGFDNTPDVGFHLGLTSRF